LAKEFRNVHVAPCCELSHVGAAGDISAAAIQGRPYMRTGFLAAALIAAFGTSAPAEDELLTRGRYLSQIMDCTGCHTEGALIGQPKPELALAGSSIGFEVPGLGYVYPPNLTSDAQTGLAGWSVPDIARAVTTGERPDGRILVVMPWQSYAALTPEDATALATYIKNLAPIRHAIPPLTGAGQPQGPVLTVR
jgi:mono/diheme cytochrome c family protein